MDENNTHSSILDTHKPTIQSYPYISFRTRPSTKISAYIYLSALKLNPLASSKNPRIILLNIEMISIIEVMQVQCWY